MGSSAYASERSSRPENVRLREELAKRPWLHKVVEAVRPPLPYDRSGRWKAQKRFEVELRRLIPTPLVVDVGAGESRDVELAGFTAELRESLIGTDISTGRHIHFLSDAHNLPIKDASVDGVVIQGVLEHVARPWVIGHEIVRILKPGGLVYCDAPFIQWYHEDPKDYYRFTEDGLKQLFMGCESVDSGVAIGPVGAAVGVWREVIPGLIDQRHLYWALKWLIGWITWPLLAFDVLYRDRARARTIALGFYLIARKPEAAS